MSTPWHQAYEDIDRIFKALHQAHSHQAQAEAYLATIRLFTWPNEASRAWCREYNEFVCYDARDFSQKLPGFPSEESKHKALSQAMSSLLALALTNSNQAIEACAQSTTVWEPWEKLGRPAITRSDRLNLILSYLATGRGELLREHPDEAYRAFAKAWVLMQSDPPFQNRTSADNARDGEGSYTNAPPSYQLRFQDSEADRFLESFLPPHKLHNIGRDSSRKTFPSALSPDIIGSLRILITALLAKEVAILELMLGAKKTAVDASGIANGHIQASARYLYEAESSLDFWHLGDHMSVFHLRAEILVLKCLTRSRFKQFNGMQELLSLTLKIAPTDIKDAIRTVANEFHSNPNQAYADFIRDAESTFIDQSDSASLVKLARKTRVPLSLLHHIFAFDLVLNTASKSTPMLFDYYTQYKSKANVILVRYEEKAWSAQDGSQHSFPWHALINLFVEILLHVKHVSPHDVEILSAAAKLVSSFKDLADLWVCSDLNPDIIIIYKVIRDWPGLPDVQLVQDLVLNLRRLDPDCRE